MNTSDYSILTDLRNMKANDPRNTFQIIEQIGEGAYGRVFKALNKITDQLVAIKICQINEDEQVFYNELESLRAIEHPFIVRLLDACKVDDELWLILEYCQLGSVADTLKITKKPFTEPEIACICFNILLSLDYLHKKKRMHRDIKPANLLINHVGHVKLTDFGIATAKTHTNTFIGSPLWMAPEQAAKKDYMSNVDIWAIGICILEMAELYTPFQQLHYVRVLQAIQTRPQTTFRDPSKFSVELNNFLSRCLIIDPTKRASASELLEHPFIIKHKSRFTETRIQFYTDKKKIIEEFRLKKVLQNHFSNKEYTHLLEEFLVTERENHNNSFELINTKGRSMQSEIITVIEKSLNESSQSSLENIGGPCKSQLYLAIKSVQQTGGHRKRKSVESLSIKIKSSSRGQNQNTNKSYLNYSSNNNLSSSPRRDVIREGGNFLKISSKLHSTNHSMSSGPGIPQHCKESLGRYVRANPSFHLHRKTPSPVLTQEAEDSAKSNANLHPNLQYPSEKFFEKNARVNLSHNEVRINMDPADHHKENYKHINVSNFIAGLGRKLSPQDLSNSSSESDTSCNLVSNFRPLQMLSQDTKLKQKNKKPVCNRRNNDILQRDHLIHSSHLEHYNLPKPSTEFKKDFKNILSFKENTQINQILQESTNDLSPLSNYNNHCSRHSYIANKEAHNSNNPRANVSPNYSSGKHSHLFYNCTGTGPKTIISNKDNEVSNSEEGWRLQSKVDTFGRLTFESKTFANSSERKVYLEEARTADFSSDPIVRRNLFANETEKSIGTEPAQIISQDISFKDPRFP